MVSSAFLSRRTVHQRLKADNTRFARCAGRVHYLVFAAGAEKTACAALAQQVAGGGFIVHRG